MPISAHYGLTVLIWGLTWTAIRLQVEAAPVDIAVFYRFVMASAVALVVLALMRRLQKLTLKQHGWLVLQGLTLYSVNFLLIYRAAESMTSGLLAVPGSIIAFYCYITVIQTLGADKAGYATVLFPVVALSVSTWLEGFEWTATAVLGASLALLGNYVLFRSAKT